MIRLLLRRHRVALVSWVVGLLALVAVTIPSYEATYGDPLTRMILVQQLQDTPGLTVLYGALPDPGTLGQLFAWETGTYVLVLAAVMASLLGVAATRGEEDAGTTELVRSIGVRPHTPLAAALALLTLACLAVGGGTAAILSAQAASVDELGTTGGILFATVLVLSSLALGLLAVVAAQLRGDRRSAGTLALTAVAVAFLLRVLADQGAPWLRWVTPLGWRDVVRPYTDDRFWPLLPMLGICVAIATAGALLARGRELGGAWLRGTGRSNHRLRVRSSFGWAWRDARGSVLGWSAAILGCAALFASMTRGLVTTLEQDRTTAELLARMGGEAQDPVGMYFSFLGLFLTLLALICGVALTLRWRNEESSGRLVAELGAGTPRWSSLVARASVAGVTVTVLTAFSGLVLGLVGRSQLDDVDPFPYALASTLGDLPGVLAGVGLAVLAAAVVPRLTGLLWAVVAASGFLVLLGGLVDAPTWLIDLSLLGHTPTDGAGPTLDWSSWLAGRPIVLASAWLVCLGAAGVLVGRRDLRLG
ncbi:ABC transporter permease [Ornithinimicrobium pratense]|uniref:Polyketide antibiotic transporter n=1 Tax=Ornithinimicrobium pratense TaxID=2593973 RepID=A0A5J6V2H4_9MICO|nr:hypothetical protein [Ornithinimicrobium pratense]QFG68110.1 hypothetical protein FY030_04735 [Ornithinimicrobium pratense]